MSFASDDVAHHQAELVEVYFPAAVDVHFTNDLFPDLLLDISALTDNRLDFAGRDGATAILVEDCKRESKLFLG